MLKKEKKKPEKRTGKSVESGEVKMGEAKKHLEFEETLYVLHLRDSSSRIVLRHVVLRAVEHEKKRRKRHRRKEREGLRIKRARFNFRS